MYPDNLNTMYNVYLTLKCDLKISKLEIISNGSYNRILELRKQLPKIWKATSYQERIFCSNLMGSNLWTEL